MVAVLYICCSTAEAEQEWLARAGFHSDLQVIPLFPVRSALQTLHEIAAKQDDPFLFGMDYIWVGLGMGRQVERLLGDLNARFPNWAVCGNRGARWDGELLDFSRELGKPGLRTSCCAHPVISVDDNLLLVNPRVMRAHRERVPAVESARPGVLLPLECLANASVMAVSPRLMTLRRGWPSVAADQWLASQQEVQAYYWSFFADRHFPLAEGSVDFGEGDPLADARGSLAFDARRPALQRFDDALARAIRKPSLTICCRTQFRRPEMLARTVASFDACRGRTDLLGELRLQLVTDQTPEIAEPMLARLREAHPDAGLGCWFAKVREERLSRIDLHRAAMERAETDYIWLIDDDDYANAQTVPAMARCLAADAPLVVIASTAIMNEIWGEDEAGRKRRVSAERGGSYPAHRVREVFKGDNRIPTPGMVLPVKLMRERFRAVESLGEFHEDYYLLLLALTSPRVEICILDVELTTISVRGKENTYGTEDWSVWHQSYASFLLELLNQEEGNPWLWQMGNGCG